MSGPWARRVPVLFLNEENAGTEFSFTTTPQGVGAQIFETIDLGLEWEGPGSADITVSAFAAGVGAPFWIAHQTLGTGGSLYFSWRGFLPLHQPEELVVQVSNLDAAIVTAGCIVTGWSLDQGLLPP